MSIDLVHSVPEDLADRASLAELLDAVKSVETWTERHAEVLDYLYRRHLVASLSRHSTLEDLRELDRHLAQVTNPIRRIRLNGLGKPYWDRWQAYRDLLEIRIALLRSAAPQRLAAQPRIREILERVARTPVLSQASLIHDLRLGRANATRILNLMEQNGLIERDKIGRENRLRLGLHGARFIPDAHRVPGESKDLRGQSVKGHKGIGLSHRNNAKGQRPSDGRPQIIFNTKSACT